MKVRAAGDIVWHGANVHTRVQTNKSDSMQVQSGIRRWSWWSWWTEGEWSHLAGLHVNLCGFLTCVDMHSEFRDKTFLRDKTFSDNKASIASTRTWIKRGNIQTLCPVHRQNDELTIKGIKLVSMGNSKFRLIFTLTRIGVQIRINFHASAERNPKRVC